MCVQREKKSGAPVVKDGKPVELTSHTLNPVPCAIGGPGLPPGLHFRWGLVGGLGGEVDGLKGAGTTRLGAAPASGSATHSACTAAAAGRTCRALGWPTVQPRLSTCSGSRWGDGSGRMGGALVTKQLGGRSGPEFSGIVGQLFLCLWCCCCHLCRRQTFTSPLSSPRRRSEAAAAGSGRAAGQHERPTPQRPLPAQPQVGLHTIRRTGHYTAAKPGPVLAAGAGLSCFLTMHYRSSQVLPSFHSLIHCS